MIAISSLRPFAECTDEIAFNQQDAHDSWVQHFERIIYYNAREGDLADDQTEFVEASAYPTIRELMSEAAYQEGWACLINADIQIGSNIRKAFSVADKHGFNCAMSLRWELPEDGDPCRAKIRDSGLDFFAALPEVWAQAAREVPRHFRIGHCIWDTWLLAFFTNHNALRCVDMTKARFVFHPKHGARRSQYDIKAPSEDPYLNRVRFPLEKIVL